MLEGQHAILGVIRQFQELLGVMTLYLRWMIDSKKWQILVLLLLDYFLDSPGHKL